MNLLLDDGVNKTELHVAPANEHTIITLKCCNAGSVLIYENDEIIGWLALPIMKIVRALRTVYPKSKYELK